MTSLWFLVATLASFPFLLSSVRLKPVTPGIIVGGGRIGSFLYESNGKIDTLLSRSSEESINEKGSGPIYICTRNDDLASVIAKTPASRRSDLVFLQNGMLGPFLDSYGLADNTQGLIYFAVSKKGEAPIDGKTDLNPEGIISKLFFSFHLIE